MSTCPKKPLGDIFNAIGEPIEISGTITNNELDNKLKSAYIDLEKNPRKTESQKFAAHAKAGVINALSKKKQKLSQYGGETEEERKANDNKALLVVIIITMLLCDMIYGSHITMEMRTYIGNQGAAISEKTLGFLTEIFNGVVESYAKALPGMSSGCTTKLDYTIDIVREIPFVGNYLSVDGKLPTCAQRMLSYNETVASLRKVGMEIGIGIMGLATATAAGSIYKKIWNDTEGSTVNKIAAVCGAITSDTYNLGGNAISSILYLPMASARALSRIVPNATATVWSAATSPYQWFENWATIGDSAQRVAITSGSTSDGAASDGTTASDGAASEESKKRPRTDESTTSSGGRRTRRRKTHNKAAKKSRKQKKKRSSTKHKRRGRKTRRGGMGCGKHKTKRRRR